MGWVWAVPVGTTNNFIHLVVDLPAAHEFSNSEASVTVVRRSGALGMSGRQDRRWKL